MMRSNVIPLGARPYREPVPDLDPVLFIGSAAVAGQIVFADEGQAASWLGRDPQNRRLWRLESAPATEMAFTAPVPGSLSPKDGC